MKLMIEIPEEDYIRLRDEGMFGNVTTFKRAVREGIPLDQEPCDAVSRKEVMNMLHNHAFDYATSTKILALLKTMCEEVDRMPSVTPQYTEAEIQKMQELEQAEIQKAYELGKAEMQPCEDAISRQAAIDELYKMLHDCFGADDEELDAVITTLNQLPPVIPTEKVGHWEWKQYDITFPEIGNYHCSSCDAVGKNGDNYCPNCGAKMSASPTRAEGSKE